MVDALIIGGGPAGATLAVWLARKGWEVALVERSEFPRKKVCGEFVSSENAGLLESLKVAADFDRLAGPHVRKVGFFSRRERFVTTMRGAGAPSIPWGRALSREQLDTLLLNQACSEGVTVFQPWSVHALNLGRGCYSCRIGGKEGAPVREMQARIVIAAHGSWETGKLPTQPRRAVRRGSDLLAFKAHFRKSKLDEALMPLLAFPGGYGGTVHCDDGRASLSCCLRRDQLELCRRPRPELPAAHAVFEWMKRSNDAVADLFGSAQLEGQWLAAGPMRPGMHSCANGKGVFLVGNAAGEAHPAIASGISMALQSARLLSIELTRDERILSSASSIEEVSDRYARAWRSHFLPRIRASAAIAHWCMRPAAVASTKAFLRLFPALLGLGASFGGKRSGSLEPEFAR